MRDARPAGERAAGATISTFVHPDDAPALWDRTKELLAGGRDRLRVEKSYYRKDGAEIWTDLELSLVRDPHGDPQYVVAMMENITERHHLQTRLRHQALHDPLTGLPNRTLFFERLDAALLAGTGPGVCYLDLDGFTEVNDTLGHDKGDALLRIVAHHLTEALGGRHLVARMGGDEFVVLVERDADADTLRRVARAALDAVRRPLRLDDHEVAVSASVGVVRADGGQDAAELMKAADTTLYWAKADGRNRYALFDEDRHRSDVDRFAVAARMPEALARGEFGVEYQPLVRLADRTAIGVEALVRWTLPGGRRLDPGRFVPLAEDSGFIVPLGRWVLTQACRQAAGWAAADPAVRLLISVNVAARQVREPAYVDDVATVLDETGWPAELLQLELTESALMGTPDGSLAALHALAEMGVRIAIDDFGTGYSNFAYLRRLPVHALKLAGPFVTGAAAGAEWGEQVDREVVGLVIALAHTLGLTVTAESVETADQFAHLQQLGCDTGQGWFFAVPVPAEQIPPLLARRLGELPSAGESDYSARVVVHSAGILLHRRRAHRAAGPARAHGRAVLGAQGRRRLVDPQGRARRGRRPARGGRARVHRGARQPAAPRHPRCRWARCASPAASGSPSSRSRVTSTPTRSSATPSRWSGRAGRGACRSSPRSTVPRGSGSTTDGAPSSAASCRSSTGSRPCSPVPTRRRHRRLSA